MIGTKFNQYDNDEKYVIREDDDDDLEKCLVNFRGDICLFYYYENKPLFVMFNVVLLENIFFKKFNNRIYFTPNIYINNNGIQKNYIQLCSNDDEYYKKVFGNDYEKFFIKVIKCSFTEMEVSSVNDKILTPILDYRRCNFDYNKMISFKIFRCSNLEILTSGEKEKASVIKNINNFGYLDF